MIVQVVIAALAGTLSLLAQSGDKAGESQSEVVPPDRIPPAPVLSPAEEAATFRLPPGLRAELVAAEPMVQSPVAMQFDPQGRLLRSTAWNGQKPRAFPNASGRAGKRENHSEPERFRFLEWGLCQSDFSGRPSRFSPHSGFEGADKFQRHWF